MKKLIIAVIFFALISPVFAQNNSNNNTDMYYVNVSLEKIYPTNQGYVIMYRTQRGFSTVGIPNRWFTDPAGRADLVRLPTGSDWPTMSIFYVDGEFSHVRLYVHAHRGHRTWGNISQGTNVSRFFPEGDTLDIRF